MTSLIYLVGQVNKNIINYVLYIFILHSSVYLNEDEKQQQTCVNDAYQCEKWALLAVSSFVFFFYSAFSISPSLFLSLGFDLSSSDLINMEPIWGKGGVRSVCASAFIRGWPQWGPWHSSIKRREDEQGRGGMGPPSAAILGFRVLTPLAVPGCISPSCLFTSRQSCRWTRQSPLLIFLTPVI